MCLLCVEVQKQKMTMTEVARAIGEMQIDRDHFAELLENIENNLDLSSFTEELHKELTRRIDVQYKVNSSKK